VRKIFQIHSIHKYFIVPTYYTSETSKQKLIIKLIVFVMNDIIKSLMEKYRMFTVQVVMINCIFLEGYILHIITHFL